MKINELINKLKELKEEKGNIEIYLDCICGLSPDKCRNAYFNIYDNEQIIRLSS